MILGIGTDLVDIRRIEHALDRFGVRLLDRLFTPAEQARAERLPSPGRAAAYAKRFAAKEACAKALGTGVAAGVFWRDLGVVSAPGGAPAMELTGGALHRLNAITPEGMIARVHLSLTDEYPLAQAFVTISAAAAGLPAIPVPTASPT
ncbi:MAG: holo-ACP synthase [Rhodospirillaceae bacterium]